jgi:GNAT superfamily N-acetyltransferase
VAGVRQVGGAQQRHLWRLLVHGIPSRGRRQGHYGGAERDRKLARVRAGTAHAALVVGGGDCLGWCQFGAPGELPRIKNRAAYEKAQTASPDWRIACCYAGKGYRRQGVAAAALAGALDLIAALGGGTVEGYPEDAGSVPAGFLYNGALSTYEKLGFTRNRKIGKHRWVVTKLVKPESG